VSAAPHPPAQRRSAAPSQGAPRLRGFTLIEMMIVVAILSVIAAAALPQYLRYVHRSRRVEALYGLRAIHHHQTTYYSNDLEYTNSFEVLGVPVEGGRLREDGAVQGQLYTYSLSTWKFGNLEHGNYRATAAGDIDGSDATLDIVIIENRVTVGE
jgi:prepilin-type N-terminal cleavage/methylation domain-containing protein